MMEEEARAIQKEYPDIQHWSTNIDAQMMWLTKSPEDYSVIVAGNMFGDIVSDAFAGLVGGLGFACSANIGDEVAVFEPTHGSAPKYEATRPADRESDRDDPHGRDDARPHRRGRTRRPDPCCGGHGRAGGVGQDVRHDETARRPGRDRAGSGHDDTGHGRDSAAPRLRRRW